MTQHNYMPVDYRHFRLNKLCSAEFNHLLFLLYWPVFGLLFMYAEHFHKVSYYYPVHCRLDDLIPFCEIFVLPYMFWFIFLAGMLLYTLLSDVGAFRRMMKFIIITYTASLVIYFIFPTCQNLRPSEFERDNVLTRFMAGFYNFDTNTNVCPSMHVIGSIAAMLAAWDTKRFSSPIMKTASGIVAVLICLSTVFLKQHSAVDVFVAIPICAIAYIICYGISSKTINKEV